MNNNKPHIIKQIVFDLDINHYISSSLYAKAYYTPDKLLDKIYYKIFNHKQITTYDEDLFNLFMMMKKIYKDRIPLRKLIYINGTI